MFHVAVPYCVGQKCWKSVAHSSQAPVSSLPVQVMTVCLARIQLAVSTARVLPPKINLNPWSLCVNVGKLCGGGMQSVVASHCAMHYGRRFTLGNKSEMLVVVRQEQEQAPIRVDFITDKADKLVLHWGASRPGEGLCAALSASRTGKVC